MMGDWFWNVATSFPSLGLIAAILVAALIVGWLPLLKYVPGIGPYVPVARLVALLAAGELFFLIGFRVADERAELAALKATIAAQRADLNAAESARDDANHRATTIEKDANAQREADDAFISTLKPADPDCGFEPFPDRVRNERPAAAVAGSPAAPRSADDLAGAAGAGSELPVSVVRRRWLPWQKP